MSNFNSRSFIIEGEDSNLGLDILNEDDKESSLKEAIIDLYLNVKIRNSDDVSIMISTKSVFLETITVLSNNNNNLVFRLITTMRKSLKRKEISCKT